MKLNLFRLISLVVVPTLLSGTLLADTIKLKNGSIVKGKVTTYNQREFTIYLDFGTSTRKTSTRMVIAVEDVESIEFDSDTDSTGTTPSITDTVSVVNSNEVNTPVSAASKPEPTSSSDAATTPGYSSPTAPAPVIEKRLGVFAAADWTSTEIEVKKGQRISITASGQVNLGSNHLSDPDGIILSDPKKLLLTSLTGALIAVIGDDNDEFIAIGKQVEFMAPRTGVLFLSVNEGNLKDNTGSFSVTVRVSN